MESHPVGISRVRSRRELVRVWPPDAVQLSTAAQRTDQAVSAASDSSRS